jgi:hypothetical protein
LISNSNIDLRKETFFDRELAKKLNCDGSIALDLRGKNINIDFKFRTFKMHTLKNLFKNLYTDAPMGAASNEAAAAMGEAAMGQSPLEQQQ